MGTLRFAAIFGECASFASYSSRSRPRPLKVPLHTFNAHEHPLVPRRLVIVLRIYSMFM